MALDWGMAAVIVAIAIIPLVISSTAADVIQLLFRKLRGFIWPYTTQCESILWEDMPYDDNGIHDCGVTPDSCLHRSSRGTHITNPRCWNSTIAIMFNRAWNSPGRRARKPFKKPLQLDPNQTYLRTDAKTLLAFFAYATSKFHSPSSSDRTLVQFGDSSSFGGLKFEDAELELEEITDPKGGKAVLVAHIKGSLAETEQPIKLTRKEIQNMINGYPPLYRETFQIRPSAPAIPYPIKNLRDAQVRGSWIIAAGMGGKIDTAMPIYFDPLPPGSHDSVDPCDGFGQPNSPLTRVLQTLKLIQNAFSSASANDQKNIEVVIKAITMMHGTRTESGVHNFIVGTDLDNVVPITLSTQQCTFVLELFKTNVTENSELSISDQMQLGPILLQVLYVALWGAIRVVRYYKDNFNQVTIPELLKKHDIVYLRGCDGE